jgi:HEAT repeat protein
VDYVGRIPRLDPVVTAALVEAARSDSNVNVRLAAIDALVRASSDPEVRHSLASSLPQQESPLVQAALIDYLVDAKDAKSSPSLKTLLSEPLRGPDSQTTRHPRARNS